MESIQLLRHFCTYNTWANRRIYAACATLDDTQRKRDMGAYFGSIHATLNHLLLTDRMWLARLAGRSFAAQSLRDELYADFSVLRDEREITDAELTAVFAAYAESDLDRDLEYVSLSTGQQRRYPLRGTLLHLCNHQTHHRGQITALLSRLGGDYGDIDMLFMPSA